LSATLNDEAQGKKRKGPDIGLRQARRMCQLSEKNRLSIIAEGLPIILNSAQGFWKASQQLDALPREAKVLESFADEEAAKILILMDAVRCPPKLVSSRLNVIIGWFYDHLARLIYAEAASWKPMHLAQLREYVDRQRRGHYIEGYAGEYIMPNWAVYSRESGLYADVEASQDGELHWSSPCQPYDSGDFRPFRSFLPPALRVAEAMQQLGLFTASGLKATSDIWGAVEYREGEDRQGGEGLTEALLRRLRTEGLMTDTAQDEHVRTLYGDWQIPMYNLEFSLIPVPIEQLRAEQEAEYWSMVGDPR
jgi:hypothetical protein